MEDLTEFLQEEPPVEKRGRKSAAPSIVVEDLEPARPSGAKDTPNLSRADQIVFAYMARGLEMLNAIASCPKLPVSMRQRAAEMMVESAATVLRSTKANGKGSSIPAFPHIGAEPIPPMGEPSPNQGIPDEDIPSGWGEERPEDEDLPVECQTVPLPPPPPQNISGDASVKNLCEQKVLKMLDRKRTANASALKICVLGNGFKPMMDIKELLSDMVIKGTIAKHSNPGGGIIYYRARRPPKTLPAFQAQS